MVCSRISVALIQWLHNRHADNDESIGIGKVGKFTGCPDTGKSESTRSSSTEKPQFWVSRVDENTPGFIGPPQLLGSVFSADTDPKAVAWAENPYTLVVSIMDGLYWWHVQ
jgi:hypothetical protein